MKTLVPWILSVLTVAAGIWQFSTQQMQANRQPFLQKQLELCFQATETAGRLASETDPIEWEKARITFWRLYWGPLSIVEDQAVEGAMVKLGRLVPDHPVSSPELPMKSLGVPSYETRACGARTGVAELAGVYAGTDRTERGKRAMTCLARASAWKSRAQIETTTDRAGVI
jgi:hypothetical protein